MFKKRVPIVIVHDSSSSSDEEEDQPRSNISQTSLLNNSCQPPQQSRTTLIKRNPSKSPDLDNLQPYNSDSDTADLPLSSDSDNDNESDCGNTVSTITTISSTSSVYHSFSTGSAPNSPEPVTTAEGIDSSSGSSDNNNNHTTAILDANLSIEDEITRDNTAQADHNSTQQTVEQAAAALKEMELAKKKVRIMVYSDYEDMDISNSSSENEKEGTTLAVVQYQEEKIMEKVSSSSSNNSVTTPTTTANQSVEDIGTTLTQIGITNEKDIKTISKYCISKLGRLHCQFNPSSSNNRGCHFNFGKDEIVKFKTHLSIFHHIETCEIIPTTPNNTIASNSEETYSNKALHTVKNYDADDDAASVSSSLADLYAMDVEESSTTEDESHVRTPSDVDGKEKEYNPEETPDIDMPITTTIISQPSEETATLGNNDVEAETTITQQNGSDNNSAEVTATTKEINPESSTIAETKTPLTKIERRKLRPIVSKVTPKLLRSTTKKATAVPIDIPTDNDSEPSSPRRKKAKNRSLKESEKQRLPTAASDAGPSTQKKSKTKDKAPAKIEKEQQQPQPTAATTDEPTSRNEKVKEKSSIVEKQQPEKAGVTKDLRKTPLKQVEEISLTAAAAAAAVPSTAGVTFMKQGSSAKLAAANRSKKPAANESTMEVLKVARGAMISKRRSIGERAAESSSTYTRTFQDTSKLLPTLSPAGKKRIGRTIKKVAFQFETDPTPTADSTPSTDLAPTSDILTTIDTASVQDPTSPLTAATAANSEAKEIITTTPENKNDSPSSESIIVFRLSSDRSTSNSPTITELSAEDTIPPQSAPPPPFIVRSQAQTPSPRQLSPIIGLLPAPPSTDSSTSTMAPSPRQLSPIIGLLPAPPSTDSSTSTMAPSPPSPPILAVQFIPYVPHVEEKMEIEKAMAVNTTTASSETPEPAPIAAVEATTTADKSSLTPVMVQIDEQTPENSREQQNEPTPQPTTAINAEQGEIFKDITPGSEAVSVIPAVPSDGVWPFQFGFGFHMKNKYHCNVTRSSGPQGCKASFLNRQMFIQHLNYAHHLHERNAMTYRESEDDENVENHVIDMIISTNLPSNVIQNKQFMDMVTAVRGPTDNLIILPNLERTRYLVENEFRACQSRIKQLLQSQESVSLSVHVWKCPKIFVIKGSILIVTAFYIDDETWNLKDVIIGFHPLKDGEDQSIQANLNNILESFDIVNKHYTTTCPDLVHSAPVEEQLENGLIPGINISTQLPCLDQIIDVAKKCLLKRIEFKFTPLKKIHEAISKFQGLPIPLADSLSNFINNHDTPFEMLNEVYSIMDTYNNLCQSLAEFHQYKLDAEDQIKIKEMLYLLSTINESTNWLLNSTNYRYPTANKAYIICMELLDSIFKVARCYGCKSINDMLASEGYSTDDEIGNSRSSSRDNMETTLNKTFLTIYRYKTTMEKVKENFIWNSMVLDTYSYAAYKGQEAKYFKNVTNQTNSSSAVSHTSEHIDLVTRSQALEIEKMFRQKQQGHVGGALTEAVDIFATATPTTIFSPNQQLSIAVATKTAPTSGNTDKRLRKRKLPLPTYFTNTDDEIEDEDDMPIADVVLKKQRLLDNQQQQAITAIIPTTANISSPSFSSFAMYISQFKRDQGVLLVSNPSHTKRSSARTEQQTDTAKSSKNTSLSDFLYSEQNNFAQMTFWNKKATPDYYPEIRKLTKQCFAVPTTSKETLRIAEEAKKHYIGLSCLYPDASPEENQKRTLLHIWRKDITYTTTH